MASIHKNKKSPYWQICYRDMNGQFIWRSSKTTDQKEAAIAARKLEETAYEARQQGGISPACARRLVTDLVESSGGVRKGLMSVRQLLQSWVDRKEGGRAKTSITRYKEVSRKFCEFLGELADQDAGLVKSDDAEAYHKWLKGKGLAPGSAAFHIKCLRSVYGYAVDAGELDRNPFKVVDVSLAPTIKKRPFTKAELRALLAVANGEWRGLLLIGSCTGARLQNCARIHFEDIDWKEKILSYCPVKQRATTLVPKVINIPILPELMRYFKSVGSASSKGPVLPSLSKCRIEGAFGLSLKFRKLMTEAGLKWKSTEPEPGGRVVHELGFHSLRHTFNSRLANAGVSQEVRQKLIGHLSKEVNDRYTHIDKDFLKKEMRKLTKRKRK